MLEIDSCYHLSSSPKSGVVFGAGITKGSEGTTVNGENIKAGKFPVLFYGSNYIENKKRDYRSERQNARIMRRLGVSTKSLLVKSSCANHGTLKSG